MGFSLIFDALAKPFLELRDWDNGAERMVHNATINIMVVVGLLVASNLMFGDPIACLTLPEFPDSYVDYIKDLCFYQDKYRVHTATVYNTTSEGVIPEMENTVAVDYYQWVPFIVFIQLILSVLPSVIWKMVGLHYCYGTDFAQIMYGLIDKQGDDKLEEDDGADTELEAVRARRWLELKKESRIGKRSTMMIYVCIKWLTAVLLYFQFYMMAKIYAHGELLWGVHITYDVINGVYKNSFSAVFPQVVICKSHRIQVGGIVNEFKFRCILPQNYMNSRVYLFLYWWYIFAVLVSIYSAIQYSAFLISWAYQKRKTSAMLPTIDFFRLRAKKDKLKMVYGNTEQERFVDYLGSDGFLLIKCASAPMNPLSWRNFIFKLYVQCMIKGKGASAVEHIEEDGRTEHRGKNKYKKERDRHDEKLQSKPLMMYSTASSSSNSPIDERYTCAPADKLSYYSN